MGLDSWGWDLASTGRCRSFFTLPKRPALLRGKEAQLLVISLVMFNFPLPVHLAFPMSAGTSCRIPWVSKPFL